MTIFIKIKSVLQKGRETLSNAIWVIEVVLSFMLPSDLQVKTLVRMMTITIIAVHAKMKPVAKLLSKGGSVAWCLVS